MSDMSSSSVSCIGNSGSCDVVCGDGGMSVEDDAGVECEYGLGCFGDCLCSCSGVLLSPLGELICLGVIVPVVALFVRIVDAGEGAWLEGTGEGVVLDLSELTGVRCCRCRCGGAGGAGGGRP